MKKHRPPTNTQERSRSMACGFSLVEAVFSILIVGVLAAGVMNTVGASQKTLMFNEQRSYALFLAQDLMDEIMLQDYEEPVDTPGFGREGGGEVSSQRNQWDDVDDYDGWSGAPPQQKDGSAIAGADSYKREVEVVWLDGNDLNQDSATESGIKRVRVTVKHGDRVLVNLTAMRAYAWKDPITTE